MATTSFKIEGLAELEAVLKELGSPSERKQVARRALRKAAKPMLDDMKALAPVNRGHLRKSIRMGAPEDAGKQEFARVLQEGGSKEDAVAAMRDIRRSQSGVFIILGPGRNPQAIFQEFGTEHHAPQPFVRPAFDSNKDKVIQTIAQEVWADIDRVAKRRAKKAARLDANADLLRAGLGGE